MGDTKRASEIGWVGRTLCIFVECPGCNQTRWIRRYSYRRPNYTGYCVHCRNKLVPRLRQRGEKAYHWRGGKVRNNYGYIEIYMPSHPHARNKKYVLEHRLVMESILGRFLLANETVHHINGDRADNHPENLQLLSTKHCNGSVYRCLDCGSINVMEERLATV